MSEDKKFSSEEEAFRAARADWERSVLQEEMLKLINENREEIIRRTQERIRKGPDEQA